MTSECSDQVTLAQDFTVSFSIRTAAHDTLSTLPLSAFIPLPPLLNHTRNNTHLSSSTMAPTNQAPLGPGPFPVQIPVEQGTSGLWDRLTNWAAENKGVVYTIAGVTLVVGAGGAIYYMSSDSRQDGASAGNKRKKQRDRKRAKERDSEKKPVLEEAKAPSSKPEKASVAPTTEDELPEVDESSVAALSDEVRLSMISRCEGCFISGANIRHSLCRWPLC
jgi:hypothetical protein